MPISPAKLEIALPALRRAVQAAAPDCLERTLAWLEAPNHHLVMPVDEEYPELLRHIDPAPEILFVKGRLELLNAPTFAIVGSRNATAQGLRDARAFAEALSHAGVTIASGLTLGIDAAAHRGALAGSGSSIAVVGTGLDIVYPERNADLAEALAERGAIVSEFGVGMEPLKGNFPRRNRIISGLSRGVLVVEAAKESGSLITAHAALKQNRDVFALPGSIHSPLARGCHGLLKEGAALVDSPDDILAVYGWQAPKPAPSAKGAQAQSQHPLLEAIGYSPASIDDIVERTGLKTQQVAAMLSVLEMHGLVEPLPGARFQRIASLAGGR